MVNIKLRPCRQAFTIIETLVVIVLLLVVAAILFPVFAKVREGGGHGSCMSNEKQLGLAFAQYIADYNETYPGGVRKVAPLLVPSGWAGQFFPYVKSTGVFRCPDDPTTPDSANSYETPISYAYNWNIGYVVQPAKPGELISGIRPANVGDLTDPSRTILLCEVQGVTCDIADSHGREASSPAVLGGSLVQLSSIDGSEADMRYATGVLRNDAASAAVVGNAAGNAIAPTGIHADGSYFLLADGHVKWLRAASVSAGLSNNIGPKDCTAGQGLAPVGKAGNGYAAGTACKDPALVATFSIN